MTTPDALAIVERLVSRDGRDLVVGVGSLRRPDDAGRAQRAGASFLVTPHAEPDLAAAMRETALTISIGALTPTEVVRSVALGSHMVKLFPGSFGGPGYLSALRDPFPDIQIMPTGGVTPENLPAWVEAGALAVGAGSALFPRAAVETGDRALMEANAKRFVDAWASTPRGRPTSR